MYLETILVLSKKNQSVRAIDIGKYMGYSKPSVSRAIGLLKKNGYVISDKDGFEAYRKGKKRPKEYMSAILSLPIGWLI